jgi:hypothetical protein
LKCNSLIWEFLIGGEKRVTSSGDHGIFGVYDSMDKWINGHLEEACTLSANITLSSTSQKMEKKSHMAPLSAKYSRTILPCWATNFLIPWK